MPPANGLPQHKSMHRNFWSLILQKYRYRLMTNEDNLMTVNWNSVQEPSTASEVLLASDPWHGCNMSICSSMNNPLIRTRGVSPKSSEPEGSASTFLLKISSTCPGSSQPRALTNLRGSKHVPRVQEHRFSLMWRRGLIATFRTFWKPMIITSC